MKRNQKSKLVSRRRFLRRTGSALAAAVALPNFIPASALGRNGAIPPSERIAMGFIGLGHQGSGHLFGGAWTYVAGGYCGRKEVQVVGVCDVWENKRENAAKKVNDHYRDLYGEGNYSACKPFHDFRDMLARPDIDAVLIASPPHWHATMTVMAAQAGKDMYCEKPSGGCIFEAQAIKAAVERYDRVFQAGTQQRSEYGGKFRLACELVRSGRIGQLKEIYSYRDGGAVFWPTQFEPAKPVPDGFDWDLFLGPVPYFPYDGNLNGGRFDIGQTNWGQHHFDIIQWTANMDDSGPVDLWLENDLSCFRYPNGVVCYGRPYPGEPVGHDGGACFVGTAGRIAVDRDSIVSDPAEIVEEPLRPGDVHVYHSNSHSGNFLECIRTRQKTICCVEVAHRSVSTLLLGGIVKQLKRPLKWDPVAEQFPGDDEANRMLTMAKRPPWNA